MKNSQFLLALLLCLRVFSTASAQETEFIDEKARFAIKASQKPIQEALAFTLSKYEINGTSAVWKDDQGNYVEVRSLHVFGEEPRLSQADKKTVLSTLKAGYLQDLQKAGLTSYELPYVFDGFDGVEIHASSSRGKLVSRLFFAYTRFYVISATKLSADRFDEPLAMLKTFRILNKEEFGAKLLEENLPRSFPQEPAIPRPTSDAQQAAFKGKVKTVITEHQISPGLRRERSREQYFNSRGDLEKEIFYSTNGYPTDLFTWGWLDGMRVSDNKFIDYAADEGPNENEITNLVMSIDTVDGAKPERKADERFSNRYAYSYAPSGQLLEEKMFENTGDLWERTVYKYNSGRIEATVYDEKGAINSKTVETLDSSGQIIEEIKYDGKGKLESSFIYKFEFDSVGNWVVRRTFERKPTNGRSIQKQVDIEYRKIEYS